MEKIEKEKGREEDKYKGEKETKKGGEVGGRQRKGRGGKGNKCIRIIIKHQIIPEEEYNTAECPLLTCSFEGAVHWDSNDIHPLVPMMVYFVSVNETTEQNWKDLNSDT